MIRKHPRGDLPQIHESAYVDQTFAGRRFRSQVNATVVSGMTHFHPSLFSIRQPAQKAVQASDFSLEDIPCCVTH